MGGEQLKDKRCGQDSSREVLWSCGCYDRRRDEVMNSGEEALLVRLSGIGGVTVIKEEISKLA